MSMFFNPKLVPRLPNGFHSRSLLPQIRVVVRLLSESYSTDRCVQDRESYTVSYLINSCGLTAKEALNSSRKLHFRSAEKPDSVIAFLRSHGFTNAQISNCARTHAELLVYNPSKVLLPKFNFFHSLGISNDELPQFVSTNWKVILISLDKGMLPLHKFLKDEFNLDDKKIALCIKKSAWYSGKDMLSSLAANISLLRELNVRELSLLHLVCNVINILLAKPARFKEFVNKVIDMGFVPQKLTFVQALCMFSGTSNSMWEVKVGIYREYGFSENEFQMAFKLHPLCIGLSEKTLRLKMDFLVKKMGLKPADIARMPTVLLYNFEKRIIPRCSVIEMLRSKGLLKKEVSISTIAYPSDKCFIDKFITMNCETLPQLLCILQGKSIIPNVKSSVSLLDS
ncbi:uncharacterized protein LOC124915669 [Impatiens glandulifera]|uniref:uncharacterized protein LOC124915669 n=1 Tax=Impatiens glandulifera TaxID=253017 RepID=UPI001FB0BF6B|nr:uncharacterized protein LOC124915669 [Impatiens glandulifera]